MLGIVTLFEIDSPKELAVGALRIEESWTNEQASHWKIDKDREEAC